MAEGISSLEERVGILERRPAAREVAQHPAMRFAWELLIIVVLLGVIIVPRVLYSQAQAIKDLSDRVKNLERNVESLELRGGR
jgi:hypothetical protein